MHGNFPTKQLLKYFGAVMADRCRLSVTPSSLAARYAFTYTMNSAAICMVVGMPIPRHAAFQKRLSVTRLSSGFFSSKCRTLTILALSPRSRSYPFLSTLRLQQPYSPAFKPEADQQMLAASCKTPHSQALFFPSSKMAPTILKCLSCRRPGKG